jgi:mannose-6-phosphate isomerase
MHLLEAALAWIDLDDEPIWSQIADEIVGLASRRFRDPASGFIREFFEGQWAPADGLTGRIVEPGHQYEWAWLLLRWSIRTGDSQASSLAFDLIDHAEQHGVDQARGVAMNALLTDGVVRDPQARLWPQTERIKAACAAACFEREGYDRIAAEAARSLRKYLETPLRGLWRDKMDPHGGFIEEPAPASSLYHIVGAVLALAQPVRILEEGRRSR